MSQTFQGSFVAMVTPFRNGKVDEAKLRELVEFHVSNGTDGLIPCGTTGESPTLSHDEHHRVVELVIEAARGRIRVVAGTGSYSTADAIEMTKHAERAGAAGALVVNPYYNKPTQEGLYRHFRAVAESVAIPILLLSEPDRDPSRPTRWRASPGREHRGREGGVRLARPDEPGDRGVRPRFRSCRATTTSRFRSGDRRRRCRLRHREHRAAPGGRPRAHGARRRLEARTGPPRYRLFPLARAAFLETNPSDQGSDGDGRHARARVPAADVPHE